MQSDIRKAQGVSSKGLARGGAGRSFSLVPQETVPCTNAGAGGTTPVPTPTSTASGTAVATTEAAIRTASTGPSSAAGRTHSRRRPCSSGPPGCDCPSVPTVQGDRAAPPLRPVPVFPTAVDLVPGAPKNGARESPHQDLRPRRLPEGLYVWV